MFNTVWFVPLRACSIMDKHITWVTVSQELKLSNYLIASRLTCIVIYLTAQVLSQLTALKHMERSE